MVFNDIYKTSFKISSQGLQYVSPRTEGFSKVCSKYSRILNKIPRDRLQGCLSQSFNNDGFRLRKVPQMSSRHISRCDANVSLTTLLKDTSKCHKGCSINCAIISKYNDEKIMSQPCNLPIFNELPQYRNSAHAISTIGPL